MRSFMWVVLVAACGGGTAPAPKQSTPGVEERFPAAPAEPCEDTPVLGKDVEFGDVTAGETLAIDAVPRVGAQSCTATACKDECCKRCKSRYVVSIAVERTATAVELVGLDGCSGTDCGVDCQPFGTKPTKEYRFVGTLEASDSVTGPKHKLEVASFCDMSIEGGNLEE